MATIPVAQEYLEGHADFSAYMSIDPDLQIYRRFTRLATRNLLHIQSELTVLETWFDDFDQEDSERLQGASQDEKMDIWLRNRNWETFVNMAVAGANPTSGSEEKRQAEKLLKVERLKTLMAEYQDALIRQNTVLSLALPDEGPLRTMSAWYSQKRPLLGREAEMLRRSEELACLKRAGETDRLSKMLRKNTGFLLGYFHESMQNYPRSWGKIYAFREQYADRLVTIISIILSAVFLIGAIVTLYFVRGDGSRLGLVGAFTLSFAASVGLLTNAKRSEMFGATAAYAAVLVVYVSGNSSS